MHEQIYLNHIKHIKRNLSILTWAHSSNSTLMEPTIEIILVWERSWIQDFPRGCCFKFSIQSSPRYSGISTQSKNFLVWEISTTYCGIDIIRYFDLKLLGDLCFSIAIIHYFVPRLCNSTVAVRSSSTRGAAIIFMCTIKSIMFDATNITVATA